MMMIKRLPTQKSNPRALTMIAHVAGYLLVVKQKGHW